MNHVEKLSIDADPNLQVSKQWEVIPAENLEALPNLSRHISAALNDFEIIILGGNGWSEQYFQLYDTRMDTC